MIDVVLVHAFPLDARLWEPQLQAAPEGVVLHALDLPGFGAAAGAALASRMDDFADAVRAYVRSRELPRFVLGGVSMGGYVAFAGLRRRAFGSRLAGLVLSDTRAEADAPEARLGRDQLAAVARGQGAAAVAERMLPRLVTPDAPPALRERLRAIIESQRPEAIACALEAMRDRRDSTDLLAAIDVPTLLVAGAHDPVTPPSVLRAMQEKIGGSQYVEIAGAGHLPNLEQPAAFSEALFAFARALG